MISQCSRALLFVVISTAALSGCGQLELASDSAPGFEPPVATFQEGLSTGFHDLGVHGGARYRLALAGALLHAGVLLGYEHLLQSERAGLPRHSGAFDYLGVLGLEVPLGPVLLHTEGGVGGCLFRLRDGIVHRLDLQLVVGAALAWGGDR